jgi:hypothetical protein
LRIASTLGIISGVLLLSSVAYTALTLSQRPVDYSSPFQVSFFLLPGLIWAVFVIVGGIAGLFSRMDDDRRGILGFVVFIASIFAILGALSLPGFPGP